MMSRRHSELPVIARDRSRRGFLRAAMLGMVAASWPQARAASQVDFTGVTLRIAEFKGGDYALLKAAGLDNTPYKLDVRDFSSGNVIAEAINAEALDAGSMSEIPPVFAAASGASIKIVATSKDDVNWQVVLVPKDSPINSIADLKGKRVGYVRATTAHYYLAKMLAAVGLSFNDIVAVALSPVEGQSAFNRGSLDAWAIYGYNVPFSLKDGARVLKTAQGYLSGNYVYTASPAALQDEKRSAALADLLLRMRQAYVWREANLGKWADTLSATISVPRDIVYEVMMKASRRRDLFPIVDADIASAQNVADTFRELGVLAKPVDVAPLYDRRFSEVLARPLS